MTRVGTTPAVAVHPTSRELAHPIQRSITRHSLIGVQVVSQKCLQPPHPAPCHSAPQKQISPQLVLSVSESPTTVAVTMLTRATIAAQLNIANGSHIARNCSKLPEMIQHLLIALQPRRVGAPHLVGMESNHLGYDSTAQSRQGAVLDSTISPRRRPRQHNLAKAPSSLPAIHCLFNAKSRLPQASKSKRRELTDFYY